MFEPEPNNLDAWSRSPKFEYRLHSFGFNQTCGYNLFCLFSLV